MTEQQNRNFNEQKNGKRVKYSFFTIVLLICIIELIVSAVMNINKSIHFRSMQKGLEQKRDEELNRNKELKYQIENFNSETTLESIARNNLKMAGQDEILIILNKTEDVQQSDTPAVYKHENK